jgi:hypothetical protein
MKIIGFYSYLIAIVLFQMPFEHHGFAGIENSVTADVALESPVPYLAVSSVQFFEADVKGFTDEEKRHPDQLRSSRALKICKYFGYSQVVSSETQEVSGTLEALEIVKTGNTLRPVPYVNSSVQGWNIISNGQKIPTSQFLLGQISSLREQLTLQRPWLPHEVFTHIICEGDKDVVATRAFLNQLTWQGFQEHLDLLTPLIQDCLSWSEQGPGRNPVDCLTCFIQKQMPGTRPSEAHKPQF